MTEFSEVKKLLLVRLKELTDRAEAIDDDLTEEADDNWGEAAIEAAGDEVLEEVGEVTLKEIAQIKRAISRIDVGSYGKCTACGNSIPSERLKVMPHATNCVGCS